MSYDVVVVGAGPNGLAAAILCAQSGLSVLVREAQPTLGGGVRSMELTLPGFVHDLCSTVHPFAAGSPFLSRLPLDRFGLDWVHADVPLAHPLDDGSAAVLDRSVEATAGGLADDGPAWRRLFEPLARSWPALAEDVLAPPFHVPRHPLRLLRLGWSARRSAATLIPATFGTPAGRALFAGLAAHAVLPLERLPTSAFALLLGAGGHALGWPFPRGGAQSLADALAGLLRSLGGVVELDAPVASVEDLPPSRAVLLDLSPVQVLRTAGARLSPRYRRALQRWRQGPAAFKVDWALDGPIPWRAKSCSRAAIVHVGGSFEEIRSVESDVDDGRIPERPFVLVGQHSLFDPTRAPPGRHTVWSYCHVPLGCDVDVTERIAAQIERFAPGFRDRVLASCTTSPAGLERRNANETGGDIMGGSHELRQLIARPVARIVPYATSDPAIWICSSSTPPGGGVHGMCGFHAARAMLRIVFGRRVRFDARTNGSRAASDIATEKR